jgi:hypothetical protein
VDDSIHILCEKIRALRQAVEDLDAAGEEIPAVCQNTARIRASCRMLELDISDLFDLHILDDPK